MKLSIFKNKRTSLPPRDFDSSSQVVRRTTSCVTAKIPSISGYLMEAYSQGIIVPEDKFQTIASNEIYVFLYLALMLCLICLNNCLSY